MSETYSAQLISRDLDSQSETLDMISFNPRSVKAVQETSEFQSAAIKGQIQGNISIYLVADERDAVKLGKVNLSDIYGWAETGKLSLLDYFKILGKEAVELHSRYSESFEFEDSCTDFWSKVVDLDCYFGCSTEHDMAITLMLILASTGENSYLTEPKILALIKVFNHLGNRLNLEIEEVGMISEDLEGAGFDPAVGMDFDLALKENA